MNVYKFLIFGALFFISYDDALAMKLKSERWKRFESLFADSSDTKRAECLKNLLKWRDKKGNSLLHHAAKNGDIEFVEGFIGMGLPIDEGNAAGETSFDLASEAGHGGVCEFLRANLDLLAFVSSGDFKGVQKALREGAVVDVRNIGGGTPLMRAVDRRGFANIVQLLMSLGACVTSKNNNGFTPLLQAAYFGSEGIVGQLLVARDCRACLDGVDRNNRTSLWWAACNGRVGVVRQLLDAKADTRIADDSGRTALDIARENRKRLEDDDLAEVPAAAERVARLTEIIALLEAQPA